MCYDLAKKLVVCRFFWVCVLQRLTSALSLPLPARTAPAMKTAPPGSKTLKLLSSLSHVPALTVESPAQHTAPLYESEEL